MVETCLFVCLFVVSSTPLTRRAPSISPCVQLDDVVLGGGAEKAAEAKRVGEAAETEAKEEGQATAAEAEAEESAKEARARAKAGRERAVALFSNPAYDFDFRSTIALSLRRAGKSASTVPFGGVMSCVRRAAEGLVSFPMFSPFSLLFYRCFRFLCSPSLSPPPSRLITNDLSITRAPRKQPHTSALDTRHSTLDTRHSTGRGQRHGRARGILWRSQARVGHAHQVRPRRPAHGMASSARRASAT